MLKLGLLFPGQGSQSIGMGKELIETNNKAKQLVESANDLLGFNLSDIIMNGPEEKLKDTSIAQPAILTASIAAWEVLKSEINLDERPILCAGHSLGEYSALVAAGALTFEAAVKLVHERGQIMQTVASACPGGMAAVIGPTEEDITALCQQADPMGGVQIANLNCPGQTVVSGIQTALDKFTELAQSQGSRVIPLAVSGPFHSTFMKQAADKLLPTLESAPFVTAKYPVISNFSAEPITEPAAIKQALYNQISGSVRWTQSINYMIDQGANLMIEIGPGKVLRGLMKKINKTIKTINAFNPEEIKKVVEVVKSSEAEILGGTK